MIIILNIVFIKNELLRLIVENGFVSDGFDHRLWNTVVNELKTTEGGDGIQQGGEGAQPEEIEGGRWVHKECVLGEDFIGQYKIWDSTTLVQELREDVFVRHEGGPAAGCHGGWRRSSEVRRRNSHFCLGLNYYFFTSLLLNIYNTM